MRAHSPPWSRRGGRAIKKMGPVPLIGAAGVVCSTSRSHLIHSREALLMNSVRYASIYKEASRHLLDGRSHPSLTKEGSSHTYNSFTRSDALGYDLFAAPRLVRSFS